MNNWSPKFDEGVFDRWILEIATEAAEGGHMNILTWLCELEKDACNYVELWCGAASGAHMEVLDWLYKKAGNSVANQANVYIHAVDAGHYHVVEWLREHQFNYNEGACAQAARSGNLRMLQWLREHGFPWDTNTINDAVARGNLEMAQWIHEYDCPWDHTTCKVAVAANQLEMLQWLINNKCIYYLFELAYESVYNDCAETLDYLKSIGCVWNEDCFSTALRTGNLSVVKCLKNYGCPWINSSIKTAVLRGNTEVAKWAVENGCPWKPVSPSTWGEVSGRGHLDTLKWLEEMEPPDYEIWSTICTKALENNCLKVVKWVLSNAQICADIMYFAANEESSKQLLRWVERQMY